MPASAVVYGCQGTELAPEERDFFREVRPFGFILFADKAENPARWRALGGALRDCAGEGGAPILTDKEGAGVKPLNPPHWRIRPPARAFGELFEGNAETGRESAYLCARLIAHEL